MTTPFLKATSLPKLLVAATVAAGLSVSLAAVGHAQSDPAPPARPGEGHGQHGWREPGQMRERFEAHLRQRAQLVHDALGLRSDQETAWQAYLSEMRPPAPSERAGRRMDHGDHADLTTPERLDRMAMRMSERQAAFQRHADAVKRLYAVLDARQRKTFDALANLRVARFGREGPGLRHMR